MARITANNLDRSNRFTMMIYGEIGTGKTLWSCTAPGKILLVDLYGEQGYESVKSKIESGKVEVETIKDYNSFTKFLKELPKTTKDFDTIIIDNISQFQEMYQAKHKPKKWEAWADFNLDIINKINYLKKFGIKFNKNIIFLAHQIEDKDNIIDEDIISSIVFPEIRTAARNKVMANMDFIWHTALQGDEEEDDRGRTFIKDEFVVHIGNHRLYATKSRLKGVKDPTMKTVAQDERTLTATMKKLRKMEKEYE